MNFSNKHFFLITSILEYFNLIKYHFCKSLIYSVHQLADVVFWEMQHHDLNSLDFLVWGYLKRKVYSRPFVYWKTWKNKLNYIFQT